MSGFQAVVKNSFLVFQDLDDVAWQEVAVGTSVRAKSSDSVVASSRTRKIESCQSVKLQLGRLEREFQTSFVEPREKHDCQNILTSSISASKLGLAKKTNYPSNSSISTMAPDDDHELNSNVVASNLAGSGHSFSTFSLCSLASLDEDSCPDSSSDLGDGFMFELTSEPVKAAATASVDMPANVQKTQQPAARLPVIRPPSDDFSHCNVPRPVNLAEQFAASSAQSAAPTTLMIRNIPNRYTQRAIMKELETLGFAGTYDFFYAPMDKRTKSNVGYAFVNFLEHGNAAKCMKVLETHKFQDHGRLRWKQARVSVAHIQGLEANLKHYKDAAVNSVPGEGMSGPVIMPSIASLLSAF